jgi:hypothetical protein
MSGSFGPCLVLALLVGGALGCSSSSNNSNGSDAGTKTDATTKTDAGTTFADFYSGVIEAYHCQECHHPGDGGVGVEYGHLDMSTPSATYMNLVNQPAQGEEKGSSGVTCASTGLKRVDPGNADESLIVKKVSGHLSTGATPPPCGSEMPLGCPSKGTLPCLGPMDVQTLTDWINGGAPAPTSM